MAAPDSIGDTRCLFFDIFRYHILLYKLYALIKVKFIAKFKEPIPVCLPSGPRDSAAPGSRTLFSGWGMNENGTASDNLQYHWVHVISLDECRERGLKEASQANICTRDKIVLKDGTIRGNPVGSGPLHE